MSRHTGTADQTNFVTLNPSITRVYWGQRRAWNGQKVDLVVETRWVPDGTAVELYIVASGDIIVEEVPKGPVIKKGRLVVNHKLDWKHTHVDGLPDDDEPEFQLVARIPTLGLEARSAMLYVDLGDYAVSG